MIGGTRFASFLAAASIGALYACGSSSGGSDGLGTDPPGTADVGGDAGTDGGGGLTLGDAASNALASIEISPAKATLESVNGAAAKQGFTLIAHRADGGVIPLDGAASWSATAPQVGAMSAGTFLATGALGGHVDVKATYKGLTASAKLDVTLRWSKNDAALDATKVDGLRKATVADGAVKWAYPYDDTVFPRGLAGPTLMWNGGDAADVYRVSLISDVFSYENFVTAPAPAQVTLDAKVWTSFTESTSGAATLTVARWSAGSGATLVKTLGWRIAPGSMRGTIYYWSNRQGRVMRIKPGADAPDDFSAASLPDASCTMTCHSVSADGSTLSSGGDGFGGAYDLVTNKPRFGLSGDLSAKRAWNFAALTPNGKQLVLNGSGTGGLYSTTDGSLVAGSGLDAIPTWNPAFTPDGTSLLYTDYSGGANHGSLFAFDFDVAKSKATANRLVVSGKAAAARPYIGYPSGSPDGQWAVYQRGSIGIDTRGQCVSGEPTCRYDNAADLYLANLKSGAELPLDALNGIKYPFAAGDRDRSWNFEPTFAPLSSGGYFWVVFTSRRTYGNVHDADHSTAPQMKQLWVAAIEQSPKPGTDPSHSAFRLPGQALNYTDAAGTPQNSLNMRGFWALDPCRSDGSACGTGSECCGGYCEGATCKSAPPPCASDGDKCATSADCCDKSLSCINKVCSLPGPK